MHGLFEFLKSIHLAIMLSTNVSILKPQLHAWISGREGVGVEILPAGLLFPISHVYKAHAHLTPYTPLLCLMYWRLETDQLKLGAIKGCTICTECCLLFNQSCSCTCRCTLKLQLLLRSKDKEGPVHVQCKLHFVKTSNEKHSL